MLRCEPSSKSSPFLFMWVALRFHKILITMVIVKSEWLNLRLLFTATVWIILLRLISMLSLYVYLLLAPLPVWLNLLWWHNTSDACDLSTVSRIFLGCSAWMHGHPSYKGVCHLQ